MLRNLKEQKVIRWAKLPGAASGSYQMWKVAANFLNVAHTGDDLSIIKLDEPKFVVKQTIDDSL